MEWLSWAQLGQNVKLHVSDNIVKCKEKSLTFTWVQDLNIPAGKLEKEEKKKKIKLMDLF